MQPVMDLTKGAELLYEVQFVSFQVIIIIAFTYTHCFTFADVISKSAPKSKVIRVM